ncbi:MAG: hypothetical protein C5B49_01420 [Bdellovibrio sp.]|nr:MAG: hypothetical protein C5B49_01420 [Bdellovibrio sp.]
MMVDQLARRILSGNSIVLTTHRQCDGDGLGAELALFFALRKLHKNVTIINVDATPRKYRFLQPNRWIQYFNENPNLPDKMDLVLIFDTNDERLLEPLYSALREKKPSFVFLDHHPILSQGPKPSNESLIDVTAASTGELAYRLIQKLQVAIDYDIARSLYTSITFDTQLYRFIRNSPNSHLIAADLLRFNINPEEIHRHLFGNQTVKKMAFLAKILGEIEYFCDNRVAVLRLKDSELLSHELESDESRDVVDMVMTVESLEAAALFREDAPREFKVSLRSKGQVEVLSLAESIGGGGHLFAAGAYYKGDYEELKRHVVDGLSRSLPSLLTGS